MDNNLAEYRKSSHAMLQIRQQRRLRLCQVLTLIGCLFLLAFGIINLLDRAYGLSAVLLISMCAGIFNLVLLQKSGNLERSIHILNGIIFLLCLALLITGGKQNTGILWIYPLLAINLFINRFWPAVYVYGSFLIISGLLLFSPLSHFVQADFSQVVALRFELTLLALWVICLAALRSEERAYQLLMQLHNDDIHQLAFYDPLTGLPNRRLVQDRIERSIANARRHGHVGGVLFIDLDRFKTINDSLGHTVGDQLLTQVGKRLEACLREEDSAARLGGDEFIVLAPELSDTPEQAQAEIRMLVKRVQQLFNEPFQIRGMELHVTASIGISLFPEGEGESTDILQQADIAMYQAKADGRNRFHFYHDRMQTSACRKLELEKDMRKALECDQFRLAYQPQVDAEGAVIGFEALLRWNHPVRGAVSPGEFIPVAEETGLILPLGRWVLVEACRQLAAWGTDYPHSRNLCIAVNISPRQFASDSFVQEVYAILDETGVDPRQLELELTEGMLVTNMEVVVRKMAALKKRGIRFSIDDFGTGYSSLRYLKHLPLDQLKIDQSFIRGLNRDRNGGAIVHTIIAMASHLELSLIAEGVETADERKTLLSLGCSRFQGYLFSRPLEASDAPAYLAQSIRLPDALQSPTPKRIQG